MTSAEERSEHVQIIKTSVACLVKEEEKAQEEAEEEDREKWREYEKRADKKVCSRECTLSTEGHV